jgi:hypothetical protein
MRNVLNLQRVGLNSLIIYSDENNVELYQRLCEEKKIFLKLHWITDVTEVFKSTKNSNVLILSGSVLYTKQEIQTGIDSLESSSESSTQFFERETMANTPDLRASFYQVKKIRGLAGHRTLIFNTKTF